MKVYDCRSTAAWDNTVEIVGVAEVPVGSLWQRGGVQPLRREATLYFGYRFFDHSIYGSVNTEVVNKAIEKGRFKDF